MRAVVTKTLSGAALAALVGVAPAAAQNPYQDDMACRQYAEQATAPYRDQAAAAGIGSALVGAGLGAAIGGAVGGGRGAGIGAASGAIAGTGVGVANAQQVQQYYNSFYYQCMQSRQAPPAYAQQPYGQPAYGQPYAAPQYAPQQGYGYAPQPTYPGYGYR